MAIPFIIGGIIAVGTGVLGAGAHLAAKEKREEAESIYRRKKRKQEDHNEMVAEQVETTREEAESLGLLKLKLQTNEISKFVELYEKFGKLNKHNKKIQKFKIKFAPKEIQAMKQTSINAAEILNGGIASLSSGALAGAGVYSTVMTFGAASTGTAISTLSGAAATNATLAWLGGGSLASGGLGVAGGTVALGLWVAGPAILVSGIIADSKAEEALTESKRFGRRVDEACEAMLTEIAYMQAISVRCNEFETVLKELNKRFKPRLAEMERIIDTLVSGGDLTEKQYKKIYECLYLAKAMKDILETNIPGDNQEINPESDTALESSQRALDDVEHGRVEVV